MPWPATGSALRSSARRTTASSPAAGTYTDDIDRPGQVYAYFVRSPHAHARINGIDKSRAEAAPGVLAVFEGADFAAAKWGGLICGWMVKSRDGSDMKAGPHPILAQGKVRYVGDHVALRGRRDLPSGQGRGRAGRGRLRRSAGVRRDRACARPAASRRSTTRSPATRSTSGSSATSRRLIRRSSSAAHVTTVELVNNRLVPNAIEPRAAIGEYDRAADGFTLYTTSQNPHVARLVIAAFVGVAPEHKLRVIAPDVGGGFGSKIFIYAEECACLFASKRLGRPVKWTAERSESFLSDAHGRDHVTEAQLALDAEGNFTALKVHTIANLGAYLSTFASSVPTYLYATLLAGQYKTPAIYCAVDAVYTNTTPVDAYRGAGRPEATYLLETIVETAARETGRDPAELRRKNFIPKNAFPYQTPVALQYDTGDYEASLDAALKLADYKNFAKRRAASEAKGKLRGVGFSCYIEACGIAPSAVVGSLGCGVGLWESAKIRFTHTGVAQVFTGTHSHGQGHETTFAQLIADEARRADSERRGDPRRYRQDAGRHGHLWLALDRGRRPGDRQRRREDHRQGQKDRGASARGERGRHRLQGRQLHGQGHRPGEEHRRGRVRGLRAASSAVWPDRAGHGGDGVLRSRQLHLSGGRLHLRGRGRSRHRRGPASTASWRSTTSAR